MFCMVFALNFLFFKNNPMKKIVLTLIIGTFILSVGNAQSLVIKDKTGVDVSGQTIDHYCTPGVGFVSLGLDVYNVSDAAKNVKVRKNDMALVEGSFSNICWLSCYPDFVLETPDPILIEPGSFVTNFTGDLTYGSIQGTSTVKFTFFDMDNDSDSSFVVINFIIGTLGINNNVSLKAATVSNAYPNPAVSVASIEYKLPAGVRNASIKVNNLLGNIIREIALSNAEGKVTIDVANLSNGVYFYSLIIDNSAVSTRKFIVKR